MGRGNSIDVRLPRVVLGNISVNNNISIGHKMQKLPEISSLIGNYTMLLMVKVYVVC